ncbi:hypothetical protein HIM_05427 [Hirsutella minnesotensis 3608]|uniref:ABC transporter domain-containing protein n=1 Tax=Hirsutella minnesotensis 3608 TaxID=1043627 RepID=A0A0F7ZSA9_9HYPO|nr:hypothetical protein HIM_11342 [Hirsutella minnesotensis 3608]KJZ71043.1 hypothetical protein HIM_09570 [Hirsutella minnesotensis 3608]KJZ72108.1 hypothetical protein HIM_08481 [Hirsutella minnesotensis 3608]KJZ72725.1 hypothetical protein HIM_07917 [Hirsutella minnesotensis 3608]KJZ75233.1 hypothetical protein HIM_05427 [Hirsutella minnesotensis 3608]
MGSYNELLRENGYVAGLPVQKRKETTSSIKCQPFSHDELVGDLDGAPPTLDLADVATGNFAINKYYIECFGWNRWVVFVFLCASFGFLTIFPQIWIKWRAVDNVRRPYQNAGFYWGIYLLLGVLIIACLVPGTVRFNIDPLGDSTDLAIINALKEVGLWEILSKGEVGGLDAPMPEHLLSHGQRQLVCLARAIMRRASVLVLDEATAVMDGETESLIKCIIAKHFSSHTIIAIAHRLDTILDYNRVAVIDDGRLVEWDGPRTLLQRDSAFKRLYNDMKDLPD